MCASVHAEASSAASEAVSLGPKLPSVAGLAVQDILVTVGVGGVQHLVAHTLGRGGGRGGMLVRHMYFFFFFYDVYCLFDSSAKMASFTPIIVK